MPRAYRLLVSGRVQGVGFRRTVWSIARRMGLPGYVRNLPDGRVEIVVSCDREKLEQFVARIRSLKTIEVAGVDVEEVEVDQLPSEFEVR